MLSVGQSKNPHWGRQWAMAFLAHAIKCHDKCVMEVGHHIVLLKSTRGREGREMYYLKDTNFCRTAVAGDEVVILILT